jgi:cyanophycinase
MTLRTKVWILAASAAFSFGCASPERSLTSEQPGSKGRLMLIGGGLDSDNRPVYERFLELARAPGEANVLIATAASGNQDESGTDKVETLHAYDASVKVQIIRRETDTATTVAAIDAASAMFFTGGDQKRITDRYRTKDQPTPEWEAMRRLLLRGGVIAGASAGDAMMGSIMFFTGRSAQALGIPRKDPDPDDDRENRPVPQIGPGMYFLPWALTDSHFWERDRIGRLVAALELTKARDVGPISIGIGIGEDACVEVDLATGEFVGTSVSESLLVDADTLVRDGASRRTVIGRVIKQGDRVIPMSWVKRNNDGPARPAGDARPVPVVEPGQNRQLASWQLFTSASQKGSGPVVLQLEGWRVVAWPDGKGNAVFDVEVEK